MGANPAAAYDINAACAGYAYAVAQADALIRAGAAHYALVIGAEKLSDVVDPADRSISFQAFQGKLRELVRIIKEDPAVDTVVGFAGGSRAGSGFLFVNLKPLAERGIGGQAVVARLRPKLAQRAVRAG